MITEELLKMTKREVLRPKLTKVLTAMAIAIVVGLLLALGIGLFVRDELARSIPALITSILVFAYISHTSREKNRRRWEEMKETLQPEGDFQIEAVTTNPAKPKKCVKITNTKTKKTCILPLKRWNKILEKTAGVFPEPEKSNR